MQKKKQRQLPRTHPSDEDEQDDPQESKAGISRHGD
jgi:hypothetical protein